MNPTTLSPTLSNDAELVTQSLAGDRHAFGRIVARYQSLVCALAYSATGNRTRSEDLAQETFVAAWRNLRDLREPSRLRSWLCGIARHTIHGDHRRLNHQPTHAADPLDAELPSVDALPTAQAVSNEEMAILWREVGRLPETYREPLVLYYREHKSVEHVAEALELTPDAVMQRLSRGRRLLQERMLEFVETTLERTNPGPQFVLGVEAALPVLIGAGPAAIAASTAPAGAAGKAGVIGVILTVVAPFVGMLAALGVSCGEVAQATTPRARRFAIRWLVVLWVSVLGFMVALPLINTFAWRAGLKRRDDWVATAPGVAVWFAFATIAVTLIVLMLRGKAALRRQLIAEGAIPKTAPQPSWASRIALTFGVLTAVFWTLIYLAWRTGDHAVAAGIVAGVIALGAVPLWLGRKHVGEPNEGKASGWYIASWGLIYLAILNWRLDVWLAPAFATDLDHMHRLLPMSLIHWLSAALIAWTAGLVWVTKSER
ncbi:MAG TPA: sigma-70 family RNA polymerase sigma factor [Opitutaceae bacterium]|nr:sigma-70 family RNA polymerase sigma factor [Opitutaceae bacterium]